MRAKVVVVVVVAGFALWVTLAGAKNPEHPESFSGTQGSSARQQKGSADDASSAVVNERANRIAVVIDDAEQVAVEVDGGYARELRWVLVRNKSAQAVDLSGWNVETDAGQKLAPNGLRPVRGSFKLSPGQRALIVTSPDFKPDDAVAAERENVFTAFDASREAVLYSTDIAYVRLIPPANQEMSGDTFDLMCVGGCCCDQGTDCQNSVSITQVCESECNPSCFQRNCRSWVRGQFCFLPDECCP